MEKIKYSYDFIEDVVKGKVPDKSLECDGVRVHYCAGKDVTFADKIATRLRERGIDAHYCGYKSLAFHDNQCDARGVKNEYKFVGPDLRYASFKDMPEDNYFIWCSIINPADFYALAHTPYYLISNLYGYRANANKTQNHEGNMVITGNSCGIYFAHDYKPPKRFGWNEEAQMIWDYKDCKEEAISVATDELMQIISIISQKDISNNIALVSVPSSKVDKISAVRKSIDMIRGWYEDNTAYEVYGCDKVIYDCGDMLVRNKDIPSSHDQCSRAERPKKEEHLETISFNDKLEISKEDTTFILMDDVYTTGTQMYACMEILQKNGISPQNIKRLVLGKTMSWY